MKIKLLRSITILIFSLICTLNCYALGDLGKLLNTNWRNEKSGEWIIGFYQKFAIYDNKFWTYQSIDNNEDKFEIMMNCGKQYMKVLASREAEGARKIEIGTLKANYLRIKSSFLPDYPYKDMLGNKWADNGYRAGDSVTIIGYYKDIPLIENGKRSINYAEVTYTSIYTDEEMTYKAWIDLDGKFTIKFPVENTQYVNLDKYLLLVEPNQTYLFMTDMKHKWKNALVMGKKVRFLNEFLGRIYEHKFYKSNYKNRGNRTFGELMHEMDSIEKVNSDVMNELIKKRPNLSVRTERTLREIAFERHACELGQARFTENRYLLPDSAHNVAKTRFWSHLIKPYTRAGEGKSFFVDFIDQYITKLQDKHTPERIIIDEIQKQGIELSELENTDLYKWADAMFTMRILFNTGNADSIAKAKKAYDEMYIDAFTRINSMKQDERFKHIMDSVHANYSYIINDMVFKDLNCDQNMRDIVNARLMYANLALECTPLNTTDSLFLVHNIKAEGPRKAVIDLHKKFKTYQSMELDTTNVIRNLDEIEFMTDGDSILNAVLRPYRGKKVLLTIWGTWCGPIKKIFLEDTALKSTLKDQDMIYVYLASVSPENAWRNCLKEYKLTGPNCFHVKLPDDKQTAIEKALKIEGFPAFRLVDPNGGLHEVDVDPYDFSKVESAVKELGNGNN
ncbi:MAG: thioredoxin family protein [Bacteroidaceae bacterium]|nr:thioredoxin family protein [Bacteroidaceae bacterium]